MTHIVTKERIEYLLSRDPVNTIGRALVVLLNNQTACERADRTTRVTNGEGFTQADARSGTISAQYYERTGTLKDWVVTAWMKPDARGNRRIAKYWRQLDDAAKAKLEAKKETV
jgi:hypothetical protein